MNSQQVRDIAEAAFRARFGDIDIVSINVRDRPSFDDDDEPMLDVKIIYDGKVEQLIAPDKAPDMAAVCSEIIEKVWRNPVDAPIWPQVHFIAKSDIGRRDPATE